jgi:Lrp/AsnC family leucine-responsive transcriptional regulator
MEKITLDKKDRAILKSLEKDSRALIKTISKETGIPRDVVNYRIKRMKKEGVIKGFVPICDTERMGYPLFTWVHLELQQLDAENEKAFITYLQGVENVVYIVKTTGAYHYIIAIAARSVANLDDILRKSLSQFPNLIKNYTTSLIVEEIQYDSFHRLIGN